MTILPDHSAKESALGPSQRIITELPLRELWDDSGPVPAAWVRDLSVLQLREMLARGPVRFVVADVGTKPRWFPEAACFDFWKSEVQPHLAELDHRIHLEQFPGGFCYFASEWAVVGGKPVVVLQRGH